MATSNSPVSAATIKTAHSTWDVPIIKFLIKSRDGHITLTGLKFPQRDITCDTLFTLSFLFIQDPGILSVYTRPRNPFPSQQPPAHILQKVSCQSHHMFRSVGWT